MKKSELRVAVQEMDTYQFGLKNELHNKLTKVTSYVPKKEVIDLINQLEEPEQEKVVVPQFVGDFIEEVKPNFNIRAVFTLENNNHEQGQEWALDNPDVFARAWLDGYKVEKEKRYLVIMPTGETSDYKVKLAVNAGEVDFFSMSYVGRNYKDTFTEQEIKAIDERYWAFAEEVME